MRDRCALRRLVLGVVFGLLGALTASARTYYVAPAPGGSDANPGTGWDQPKLTIQAGVNLALTAGDVVLVSNGTYVLTGTEVTIPRAITVRGYSGNPADALVSGNAASRCFTISAAATVAALTITNGSTANSGGGINMSAGTVSNCWIVCNRTAGDPAGGGVLMTGGNLISCVVSSNDATGDDGGGVLMYAGNVIGCRLERNRAGRWGGAIRMDAGFVANCTFVSNTAPNSGPGAVQLRVNSPVVSNCTFVGNSAPGAGAVEAVAGLVYGCTISSNTSSGDSAGGGIYVGTAADGGSGTVERCTITYNRVTGNDGGGAAMGGHGTMRDCLIYGNQCPRYGGGLRQDGGVLENCTIVGNRSSTQYGGIWNRFGTVQNVIIYSNTAPSDANFDLSAAPFAPFTNSCTTPMPSGLNNTTAYPLFVLMGSGYGTNHVAGNYALAKGSPCIDTGTNQSWMATALDFANKGRLNGIVDMGAYEYYPPPNIPGVVLQEQ